MQHLASSRRSVSQRAARRTLQFFLPKSGNSDFIANSGFRMAGRVARRKVSFSCFTLTFALVNSGGGKKGERLELTPFRAALLPHFFMDHFSRCVPSKTQRLEEVSVSASPNH